MNITVAVENSVMKVQEVDGHEAIDHSYGDKDDDYHCYFYYLGLIIHHCHFATFEPLHFPCFPPTIAFLFSCRW